MSSDFESRWEKERKEMKEARKAARAKRGFVKNHAGAILILLLLGSFTGFIVQSVNFNYTTAYPPSKAVGFLEQANASSSLTSIATYVGDARAALANNNGNPQWPWPTANTNYTLIKQTLLDTQTNAITWSTYQPSSYAYQQAVANIHQSVSASANNIDNANGALGWNPYINPLGWLLGWMAIFMAFIDLFAVFGAFDSYFDR